MPIPERPAQERRPLRLRLVSMAVAGVLVVPSLAACGSDNDGEDQTAYCVNAENQVVDDSNCDESRGYGGGSFFLFMAVGGFGRGSYIPNNYGTRIDPRNPAARASAGLPATGRAAGTTVKSGGIGKGSGGSTGTGSGS